MAVAVGMWPLPAAPRAPTHVDASSGVPSVVDGGGERRDERASGRGTELRWHADAAVEAMAAGCRNSAKLLRSRGRTTMLDRSYHAGPHRQLETGPTTCR